MDRLGKIPAPTQWHRLLLFALFAFLILSFLLPRAPMHRLEISYTQFKKLVQDEKIAEVTFRREEITR